MKSWKTREQSLYISSLYKYEWMNEYEAFPLKILILNQMFQDLLHVIIGYISIFLIKSYGQGRN